MTEDTREGFVRARGCDDKRRKHQFAAKAHNHDHASQGTRMGVGLTDPGSSSCCLFKATAKATAAATATYCYENLGSVCY